jgi:mutator protein MutT
LNPIDDERPTQVGIGLIEREGSYLIRQRLAGQAMAGYWEFPGGKCEAGETPSDATFRECFEEVGVEVAVGELIQRRVHRYPHGLIELHYYQCGIRGTRTEPLENSGFRWVTASDLPRYRFPEANDAVIEALKFRPVEAKGMQRDET